MTSSPNLDRDPFNQTVPDLVVRAAARALDFYKRALGAEEIVGRAEMPDGRVGHAELRLGNTTLYFADEHPEFGYLAPPEGTSSSVSSVVQLPDVDDAIKRAVEAGATLGRDIEDQFYGDRSGEILDGFGYRWTLSTKIEDVPEEELQPRAANLHEGR